MDGLEGVQGSAVTVWKLLEKHSIIGTELLGYLVVINGKVLHLSNGPRETRRRREGLVLVGA